MTIGTLPGQRFDNPDLQFCDETGLPYAGGKLYFYVTGTSTPLNTYSDEDLDSSHANVNPVVLDSAGRAGTVFLQALAYKVTLKNSDGDEIWTQDPVYTSDYSTYAQFLTYAGNPNGFVAGTAGSASTLASAVYDRTNNIIYVCTTTGSATTAVWTATSGTGLSGAILYTAVITPTILGADTNNWAPTGFSTAYYIRASSSAAYSITGIAGGAAGRTILLSNIGTFNITLPFQSASSSAANRFLMDQNVALRPGEAVTLAYDGTSAGWRATSPQVTLGSAKFWAYVTVAGGTPTLAHSYNVTSITDTGTGILTVTIRTDFIDANWVALVSGERAATALAVANARNINIRFGGQAAGSTVIEGTDETAVTMNQVDPAAWHIVGFGIN